MRELSKTGYVMFRFRKSTGKIDKTLTANVSALMKIWAMNNTTSTKETVIVDCDDGEVIFRASGKKNDFPDIENPETGSICNCEKLGIPMMIVEQYRTKEAD